MCHSAIATGFSTCETPLMATIPKKAKKRPGRPPKHQSDKLEQFSIRLPPKLKFGLELLARAQHRSLSQVVEWAVQMGMNSYEVGRDFESLTDLLTAAWSYPEEGRRLLEVYRSAPALLSYEDAAACELIDRAVDLLDFSEHFQNELKADPQSKDLSTDEFWQRVRQEEETYYWPVIWKNWVRLKELAVELSNNGKGLRLLSIERLLDLPAPKKGASILDIYRFAAREI